MINTVFIFMYLTKLLLLLLLIPIFHKINIPFLLTLDELMMQLVAKRSL